MARKDSEHQKKSMSMLFRGKAIFKPLNTGHIDEHVSCVREWIANIFFYREAFLRRRFFFCVFPKKEGCRTHPSKT